MKKKRNVRDREEKNRWDDNMTKKEEKKMMTRKKDRRKIKINKGNIDGLRDRISRFATLQTYSAVLRKNDV